MAPRAPTEAHLDRFYQQALAAGYPLRAERRDDMSLVIRALECGAHDTVLDVGCGSGELVRQLAPRCRAVGLDRRDYRTFWSSDRRRFVQAAFSQAPFVDESFSRILFSKSVFLVGPGAAFASSCRLLRRDGRIIVREPLPSQYWEGVLIEFAGELAELAMEPTQPRDLVANVDDIVARVATAASACGLSLDRTSVVRHQVRYTSTSDIVHHFMHDSPLSLIERAERRRRRLRAAVAERFQGSTTAELQNLLLTFRRRCA